MELRAITEADIPAIEELHKQYDFDFPKLKDKKNLIVYVLEDDNGDIISMMMLKQIVELVAITDLKATPRKRHQALWRGLRFALGTAKHFTFDQIHVFATDKHWIKVMKKHAKFGACKGDALFLNT